LVPFNTARDFETALARERRRRTVQLVVVPAILAILTFGADAAWRWRASRQAREQASRAWAAYSRCVLGAPLRDGEKPSVRIRRIEMNLPDPLSATGDAPWPARCAVHLDDLRAALSHGRLLKDHKAMAELDRIVEWARADLAPPQSPNLADDLWAAVEHAGLRSLVPTPGEGATTAPEATAATDRPAPLPAEPLAAASLPPLPVEIRVAPEEVDHLPADGLRILFAAPSGDSTLCSFRPDEHGLPFRTAHCADNVLPTQTDDATPGFLRNVQGRFDKFELIRPLLGADPPILSLPAGTAAIALFGDQLVWVASGKKLFARTVPLLTEQGTAELGPPLELGDVAGSSPELAACRTETSLVVRVRSYDEGMAAGRALATVAVHTGATWERAPKEVAIPADADFTCRGREATFTALDRDVIRQARCTPEGCTDEVSDPLALPWESGRPSRVSDVDGKAILVGIGMTGGPVVAGSVRTVRMRMGSVREMARAPDVVLLGDAAHEGVDVTDVRVYVRRGAALVLLTTDGPEPFRAVTVSKDGAFEALRVTKL
jgi:hypothetical protein